MISYPFPPVGGSPVQRPAKLARYLPDGGWSVEVLTAGHRRFDSFDETLLSDIPADVRVHRVPGYEPACLADNIASLMKPLWGSGHNRLDDAAWSIPWLTDRLYWRLVRLTNRLGRGNGEEAWVRPAVQAALNRHRQQPFDVVISTGPPHFVHRVARQIAARTGLPWVADLRDPLVSDFDRSPANQRRLDTMRRLEREIMAHAAQIVATSPSLSEDLRQRYPRRANAIETITNGFDREDVAALLDPEGRPATKEPPCTFVAMGSFYGRREIARLVHPLQRVLDRQPSWNGRIRLIIAGSIDAEQRRYWAGRIPEWLTFTGYLDHAAALRLAASSTCNVVVVPDCRHGHMSIPAKTYELLALPTHLLALVPPGSDTERIVRECAAVSIAPFEDGERVAETMETIIETSMEGSLAARRDWATIDRYDRCVLAAWFGAVLDKACGRTGDDETKLDSKAASDSRRLEVA
ncbi:MAG: glycosyltransferase family 4 protein [Phycisphaerales bacterium]|nr:glycosyltransferase family 4 protein [Phycisphaerales bacterium]